MDLKLLASTIKQLAQCGKGILAADESNATIGKRFAAYGIESTPETRCAYRDMLFTTPGIHEFISGIILFEETLQQKSAKGLPFAAMLGEVGILAGIKVDKGLIPLVNSREEQTTQGLDGLAERLEAYRNQGAVFTKWRAVYAIGDNTPSRLAMKTNAECLARYAAICQNQGLVPIVEPEVLIDGDHSLERCATVSEQVFYSVFHALHRHKVSLEHIVLKPSMVISGKQCATQANPDEVAAATVRILKRTVPAAVPTINFLSGGQSPENATANLNAMNRLGQLPWNVSFSYARALQDDALKLWQGDASRARSAQEAFYKRAKLNHFAALGQYQTAMEREKAYA